MKEQLPLSSHRLKFVDSARALAVLLVYFTHATENFKGVANSRGAWLTNLAFDGNFGRMGVVTFFAISGFLIPSSLSGPLGRGSVRFLISRICRLYPAFWLSILPGVYILYTLSGKAIPWPDVWLNFTMLPRWFSADYVNAGYWTLEIETVFYGLCLLIFLGNAIRNQFVLSLFMITGFYVYLNSQMPILGGALNVTLSADATFLSMHLSIMFWGALCRQWRDEGRLDGLAGVLFAIVSCYWLAYLPISTVWRWHEAAVPNLGDMRLMCGYSLGMLVFFVLFVTRFSLGRVFSWIGRISYSFYLLHGPAIVLVSWAIGRFAILQHRRMEGLAAVGLVVSLAMAQVSYSAVERPFVRLGHWVGLFLRHKTDRT